MGERRRSDLLQGTLDMLVLQTLRWGPAHGYSISQAIRAASNEVFRVETGSLYPALHRLEAQGWIEASWELSEKGKRAKYYGLTKQGKKQLSVEHARWETFSRAMRLVLRAIEEEV